MNVGSPAFPLIGVAALGSLLAAGSLAVSPTPRVVLTLGIVDFGIGASTVTTMFSLGTAVAGRSGIKTRTFNAYMRATTSTA